jgi:hypothetical protein
MLSYTAVISPLPLMGGGPASASELVQHVDLARLPGSRFAGEAELRLSRDRRQLTLAVDVPRYRGRSGSAAAAELRLVLPAADTASHQAEHMVANAAILVILDEDKSAAPGRLLLESSFDLARPIRDQRAQASAARRPCGADHSSRIEGMALPAHPRDGHDNIICLPNRLSIDFAPEQVVARKLYPFSDTRAWAQGRMFDETDAALRAASPRATAIHVQMATHYARMLRSAA